jgi:hypothetical protein
MEWNNADNICTEEFKEATSGCTSLSGGLCAFPITFRGKSLARKWGDRIPVALGTNVSYRDALFLKAFQGPLTYII